MAHLRDVAAAKGLADLADDLDGLATAPFLKGEFLMMARSKLEEIRPIVRAKFSRSDYADLDQAVWSIHRAQFPD